MGKYSKKRHFEGLIKIPNQDIFIEEFNKLTPQEQEDFIQYLHSELEIIAKQMTELTLSMNYNDASLLSSNAKIILTFGAIIAFGATAGVGAYHLTDSVALGSLTAITSGLLGLVGQEVLSDHIERASIRRFFNRINNKRKNRAINKLNDRKLKVAKKLEVVEKLLTNNPNKELLEPHDKQNTATQINTNQKNKVKISKENNDEKTA